MNPLVLVTGGTGKTGRRLVSRLREHGIECRTAARGVTAAEGAAFDWTRRETWARALKNASAVYLVAPAVDGDPAQIVIDFARLALEQGVPRFVLLSASLLPAGGPAMGQMHQWLQANAPEWTVLRPSWFMQNFSEGQHLATIRAENKIYSATGNGRVPFISADDIAAAAMVALTRETSFNNDFILTGSQLLTYDDVAERIGNAIGRTISHCRLSADELAARYESLGLSSTHARMLSAMDSAIAAGAEDRITTCIDDLTGRPPINFDAFVENNARRWT